MRITICGSMQFLDEMHDVGSKLQRMGFVVKIPIMTLAEMKNIGVTQNDESKMDYDSLSDNDIAEYKNAMMTYYFHEVEKADAILVLNLDKKGVKNYIGGNTFLEMGVAVAYNKGIYLYNPIPEQPNRDEILGMKPIIINQNLDLIK